MNGTRTSSIDRAAAPEGEYSRTPTHPRINEPRTPVSTVVHRSPAHARRQSERPQESHGGASVMPVDTTTPTHHGVTTTGPLSQWATPRTQPSPRHHPTPQRTNEPRSPLSHRPAAPSPFPPPKPQRTPLQLLLPFSPAHSSCDVAMDSSASRSYRALHSFTSITVSCALISWSDAVPPGDWIRYPHPVSVRKLPLRGSLGHGLSRTTCSE